MGYHSGELAMQRRAGVVQQAARLSGMVGAGELGDGIARSLIDKTFAAITARDRHGIIWVSPLTGPPGFLDPTAATMLTIHCAPTAEDPLHNLEPAQPVGLLVIDFATRRRIRINGSLTEVTADRLHVGVDQAYGNCPQYITQRQLRLPSAAARRVGSSLAAEDIALVRRSDTFILGTTHPEGGNDASHRGGPAGFVHVEDDYLWWPDYAGNNMFNSLGNIAVDSTAALLIIDFSTGATLHLSGHAELLWTNRANGDGTGRRVRFTPQHVVAQEASL